MNKRKILTLAMALSIVAIMAVGATIAYFTAEESATNTFTVGKVEIELTEPNWDAEEKKEVYPDERLAKDPTVENIGPNPCFVRIEVTGWDCLAPAGNITYLTNYDNALGEGWVEYNGYYYYEDVLAAKTASAAGGKTTALFDQIVIPSDLTNGDGTTEFKLDVKAEAVQAQGARPSFSAVQEMTVEEIAAWFATCGL